MLRRLRQGDLLAAIFLLALATCFLWRVIFGGKVLLPIDDLFSSPPWSAYASQFGISVPHNELIGDMILQNFSWKSFAKESYRQGNFPLWNPYIFCGMPFLAAGQYAALYPLGVLFYILPVAQAYGWFTLLHLFLGGLFMYLFVKMIGGGRWGALVSAVVFTFCGFLVVSFLWPMIVSTVIWLPLLLFIIEVIVRRFEQEVQRKDAGLLSSSALWVSLGGVAVGLQFLAGHLEMSFYLLFTMMVYAAFRLLVMVWRKQAGGRILGAGLALLIMVAIGFGLAGVQLLPFYELIRENYRAGLVSYREVIGWALPKLQPLSFLMPDFFGNPTHHSYFDIMQWKNVAVSGATDFAGNARSYPFWGVKNYVEGAAYVGVLPLLLAGVALLWRRNKYTLFFFLYAVFSLLLAFGSPLYEVFFYGIPGFDQLHTPFRWVIPYTFSMAVLAGMGVKVLLDGRGQEASQLGTRVVAFLGKVASLVGIVLLLALAFSRLFSGTSVELANRLLQRSHTLPFAFQSGQMLYSYQFRNIAILALLLLASGVIIVYGLRGRGGNRLFPVMALGLVIFDLFFFGYNFNSATDPHLLDFTPPAMSFLKSDPSLYRVTSFSYDDTLKPNAAMLSGIQDIRGYDTIILDRYVRFWRLLEEPSGLLYSQINKLVKASSLESPLLDLLNVKYVLTTQDLGLPNYTEVYKGEINIYRNDDVLPRAFVVFDEIRVRDGDAVLEVLADTTFDPRRTVVLEGGEGLLPLPASNSEPSQATIIDYQPNQVTVQANMPQEGYLVLTDAYFPGWRAHSGDAELPILRADYIFRAVRLSQGEHTVVFKYSPDSFKLGLYVSLVSGVLVLLGLGYWVWRRFYGETAETSTIRRIVKNSLTPMATQVLNKVVDAAFAIFLLRFLGPSNFGNYAFAVVFIGYFSIFTDFGLGTLLTREVARDKSQANRYLGNSVIVRLGLCLASTPILIGLVGLYRWKFGLASDAAVAILLFAISLIPNAFASALSSVFNAHERMEYPAAVTVITTLVKASLGIMVLLMGWGIVGLAGVSIFASMVTAIILYVLVAKTFFKPAAEIDFTFQKGMVTTSAPLMFNNFLSTIFFRVDMMLLQPMRGSRSVGHYGTAYKFIDALNIIPSLFTLAIFPVMSRYAESARDTLVRAYCLSLKALLIVSLPITVGTTLIAGKLIPLLFGSEYIPSIVALQILIWFLPFSYVNSVTQYVIIALNRQRFLTLAFLIGASFNLVANLAVIPHWGINGAAFVTIISEMVLLVPFLYVVTRELGRIPLLRLALRPTLAALVMGGVLFPLRQLNLMVIILLGAAIYLAVLVALRTFDEEDMAVMRALRAK